MKESDFINPKRGRNKPGLVKWKWMEKWYQKLLTSFHVTILIPVFCNSNDLIGYFSQTVQCEFRIVKKGVSGPWGFLCSPFCRSQWTTSLASNHVLEKPRLIFEKLCGMCGSDLANLSRDGQYSWETREFCSKNCLSKSLFLWMDGKLSQISYKRLC